MRWIKTYEKFTKVAFHGWKMEPEDMRLPECEVEWQPGKNLGCPNFSDEPKISEEDEALAIEYLNQGDIKTLIAYSRGGAILLQSISKGAEIPEKIYLVAPAWKRGWPTTPLTGKELIGSDAVIIHGGKDDKVPVAHSAILSKQSGIPLYIYPECNHINILKYKDKIEGGIKINTDDIIKDLPDWGTGSSKPEDVEKQYQICSRYKN